MPNTEIAVNRKCRWDLFWNLSNQNHETAYIWLVNLLYKVNRNMSQISIVRLRGRIEGAALITFIVLVRFRNHQLVNKKILNLLHSRHAAKRMTCSSGVFWGVRVCRLVKSTSDYSIYVSRFVFLFSCSQNPSIDHLNFYCIKQINYIHFFPCVCTVIDHRRHHSV